MASKKDVKEKDLKKEHKDGEASKEVDKESADAEATENDDKSEDTNEESQSEEKESKIKEEDDFETKYLRMAADFQNYKRRSEEEKSRIYTNANEKFGSDLLEVLDNFERAIEQDEKNDANAQFVKGMEMVLKQLQDVLKKNGIEEIEALGKAFDPNFHHAVIMEASDEYDQGCVTEVMQKGYKLKDRVIRPSMVKVAE